MEFMDMHCDSLSTLLLTDSDEANLYQTKATMVDFARMKQAGQLAQFFAVFLPFPGAFEKLGLPPMTDEAYIQTLRQWLLQNVQQQCGRRVEKPRSRENVGHPDHGRWPRRGRKAGESEEILQSAEVSCALIPAG